MDCSFLTTHCQLLLVECWVSIWLLIYYYSLWHNIPVLINFYSNLLKVFFYRILLRFLLISCVCIALGNPQPIISEEEANEHCNRGDQILLWSVKVQQSEEHCFVLDRCDKPRGTRLVQTRPFDLQILLIKKSWSHNDQNDNSWALIGPPD